MANGIFDERNEIRNENAEREGEIALLTNYLQSAAQRFVPVPGRGDMEPVDEYRIIVTSAQRDILVEALRHYHPSADR